MSNVLYIKRKVTLDYTKYGVCDNKKIILDCIYDDCWINDGDIIVKLNNKEDHIDIHGNLLTNFKYDRVGHFYDNYSCVSNGIKKGVINEQGVEVVPCLYYNNEVIVMLEKYKLNLLRRLNRIEKLNTII